MRAKRSWIRAVGYVVAGAAVAIGCLGLLVGVPQVGTAISARAEPEPLNLRTTGTYYDEIVVDINRPGRHAIWATRPTVVPDDDRCRVVAPDGSDVPSSQPGRTIRWVEVATDDTLWTWTAGFDAPAGGGYRLSCRLDPAAPGQRYTVTREPGARLTVRLRLEAARGLMVAALPAGVVILLLLVAARRRSTSGGRASPPR